MKLDNFNLEEYNELNYEHKSLIINLCNDKDAKEYLGDIFIFIQANERRKEYNRINHSYIAYYNDEAVGYISISTKENNNKPYYEICCGIIKEYRNQRLGALLLQEFSEKMFELYKEIDELKLYINKSNISSQKTAKLVGYENIDGVNYKMKR